MACIEAEVELEAEADIEGELGTAPRFGRCKAEEMNAVLQPKIK